MDGIEEVRRVPVVSRKEITTIDVRLVKRMEASCNHTLIIKYDDTKLVSMRTLKFYSDQLHGRGFYRIHDKHLINMQWYKSIDRGRGGCVTLNCGERVKTSYRRKLEFRKLLKEKKLL